MTVVNNPYITVIVGVCSIKGRNLSLYGIIRVVKRVVAVAERVCAAAIVVHWYGGGGVCGCDDGVVVAVEKGVCGYDGGEWLWWRE